MYGYHPVVAANIGDTSDEFVVHEIFDGAYSKLNLRTDDVVVDFGLNIGMFTLYALNKGISKISVYSIY